DLDDLAILAVTHEQVARLEAAQVAGMGDGDVHLVGEAGDVGELHVAAVGLDLIEVVGLAAAPVHGNDERIVRVVVVDAGRRVEGGGDLGELQGAAGGRGAEGPDVHAHRAVVVGPVRRIHGGQVQAGGPRGDHDLLHGPGAGPAVADEEDLLELRGQRR